MCQDVALSSQDSQLRFGYDAERTLTNSIIEQLAHRVGADRFDLWFGNGDCFCLSKNGSTAGGAARAVAESVDESDQHMDRRDDQVRVAVAADNSFSLQRLQSTFGKDIRWVVDRVCGPQCAVEFVVRKNENFIDSSTRFDGAIVPVATVKSSPLMSPSMEPSNHGVALQTETADRSPNRLQGQSVGHAVSHTGSPAPPRKRDLRSFHFGHENRLAEASVSQLFERPGQFSPFFVYGPTGCGKTQLLESIVSDYRRRLRLRRCVYLSAEQFTSLFVGSLRGGEGLPMFRRKYRDLDLLVIDDVQFFAGKKATINEFQHTLDNLIRLGKQVIVSADRPPLELSSLGGDLHTRLTSGLTCPLNYPGLAGRIKIAKQMCEDRQMTLSSNVLELICEKMTRDVRRISGALNRLHALSLSTGMSITPEVAQSELSDLFLACGGNSTSMLSIETAVCDFCGVKPHDLKSSSRSKQVSTARMLAMYLSRRYTSSAFSEIGDYFGGRSHSTVIAAQKKVASWIERNEGVSLAHATYPAKDVLHRLESNLRIG